MMGLELRHPHCKFLCCTRSSCVQLNHCASRMRSKPQLRNDKHIMMMLINRYIALNIPHFDHRSKPTRFIRSTFCQLNHHHLKAISRLINSARYNRFQLLSLINKNIDRINRPNGRLYKKRGSRIALVLSGCSTSRTIKIP